MDWRIAAEGRGGEILFIPPQVQHTALWVACVCVCVSRTAAVLLKRTEEEEVVCVVKSSVLHPVSVLYFVVFFTFSPGVLRSFSLFFFFYASERA